MNKTIHEATWRSADIHDDNDLSVRALNAMDRHKLTTAAEVYETGPAGLLRLHTVGRTTLAELARWLKRSGAPMGGEWARISARTGHHQPIEFAADQIPESNSQQTEPVSLTEIRSQPDPTTVRLIEEMLEDARSGKLRAVGIVGVYEGRHTDYAIHTGDAAIADLLMAVERLKHRVLTEITNINTEDW